MPVLQLLFANELAIYTPGETVVGVAKLHFDKQTKVKCMKLNISGNGLFNCSVGKSGYMTREPYMDIDVVFSKSQQTYQEEFYIEPGDYAHQFSFLLPKNVPSSFNYKKYKICTIKYMVKLVLVKPWSFDDTYEREIFVREQFDASQNLLLSLPFGYDGIINAYTCFCCNQRVLSASIMLKRRKNWNLNFAMNFFLLIA